MSLINDMLRELDARRPDRRRSQAQLLEGLGSPRSHAGRGERLLRFVTRASFALLVLGAISLGRAELPSLRGLVRPGVTPTPQGASASEGGADSLVMAEAIKVLEEALVPELPDVAQPGPHGEGEVREVTLQRDAERTRLSLELSRESVHFIERGAGGKQLALRLVGARLLKELPELDLRGTPIRALHARRVEGDLSLEIELAHAVRTQSAMLTSGGSARLLVDFYPAQRETRAPAPADPPARVPAPAPASAGVFEKTLRAPSVQDLADQAYQHALGLAQQEEEAAAIDALQDALGFDSQHHAAREALASILLRLGRAEEAEGVVDGGLRLDRANPAFTKLKARALAARGAVAEALELLRRAEAALASDPELHALLAALHQRQGDHARAVEHYRRLLRWQSDKALWWMGLGISLEGESRPREALAAYRAASQLGGLGADSQRFIGERIVALQRGPG